LTSILLRGDGEYGSQQNANESEQKEEVLQLPDGQEIVVTAQVVAVKAVFIPWSGSDHQDKVPFNSFRVI
jgi:hypothetical protein